MLGNTSSKTLMKSGYSATATMSAIAEWNQNIFYQPRVVGSLTAAPSNFLSTHLAITSNGFTANGGDHYRLGVVGYTPLVYNNELSFNTGTLDPTGYGTNYINFNITTFTLSPSEAYRISFYAKDTAVDTGAKKVFIKVEEFNDTVANNASAVTCNSLATTSFDLDGLTYNFNTFTYLPVNPATKQIRVSFSSDVACSVNVSDFSVCKVTLNEYRSSNLFSVRDVFSGFRPGDQIVENSATTTPTSTIIYRASEGWDKIYPSNGKLYAPEYNRFRYYAETFEITSGFSGVFAYYDTTIQTNKLVVKMLNGNKTSKNTVYNNNIGTYTVYTYNESANTWTSIYSSSNGNLNDNGSLALYYNGSSWTTTESSASISNDRKSMTPATSIDGIAIVVTELGYYGASYAALNQTNLTTWLGNGTPFDPTVRYLELSPRLQVDLSTFIKSVSVSKETDSGNMPLPVGLATANNGSIEFENIPVIDSFDGSTFTVFSDTSLKSALSGDIRKDIKFFLSYSLRNNADGTTETGIPFFVGYTDTWSFSNTSATANLFDVAKYLQQKQSTDLLIMNDGNKDETKLSDIIPNILQQNGFSDYLAMPTSMDDYYLNTFYIETEKSVWQALQEILLPYMYFGYINEDGYFSVSSYADKTVEYKTPVDKVDFKFTDTPISSEYISNIISFNPSSVEKPSVVTIRYNSLSGSFSTDIAEDDIEKNAVAITLTKNKAWEYDSEEGLGFAKLEATVSPSDKKIVIHMNDTNPAYHWISFSGYGIIGSEIIKYDGMNIRYTYTDPSGTIVEGEKIVKSPQEFKSLISFIMQNQQAGSNKTTTFTYTGELMNVERGCFGTTAVKHLVFDETNAGNLSSLTGIWSSPNPVLRVQSVPTKANGKSLASPTTLTTNVNYIKPAKSKDWNERFFRVQNQAAYNAGEIRMVFDGADKTVYNKYGFIFSVPVDNQLLSKHDARVGCFIRYDKTTGSGIFFEISPNTNESLTADATLSIINASGVKTIKGTSPIKLDAKSVTKTTKYKKKDGKFVLKNKKKVIESVPKYWEMFDNVIISYDGTNVVVKLNDKKVKWKNLKGATKVNVGSFSGVGLGVYAGERSIIDLQTVYAKDDTSFIISPEMSSGGMGWASREGKFYGTRPFYVSASPTIFEMKVIDAQFQNGPAFNSSILKPIGAYELPKKNLIGKALLKISDSSTIVGQSYSTPFRARFTIVNTSPAIIPFKNGNFSSLQISSNVIVKSDEMSITKKINNSQFSTNNSTMDIQSNWIQTETNANSIMQRLINGIKTSMDIHSVQVFGNPLITIGDVVNLYYNMSGFNASSTPDKDAKYIVVGVDNRFEGGFTTTVKLRKILG